MRSDLQSLVDEPREDLADEYKSWLDLEQEADKAKVAKACIALANHGGGRLILGFEEKGNLLISRKKSDKIKEITQDTVNSAVRRYADPEFHCQLYQIEHSKTKVLHPVIRIPGDQTVPIMSTRSSEDKDIEQHIFYIRKPGPRSEKPMKAEEWRKLLERCIQARRQEMFDADAIKRGSRDTTIEQHVREQHVREQHVREQHAREQYAQEQHVREPHVRYIRKPGPRSEKPTKAEEMLDAIRTIVLGSAETGTTELGPMKDLDEFCTASFERWEELTKSLPPASPARFPLGYYEITVHPVVAAPLKNLNLLQERLDHARRIKLTGWSPFIEINNPAVRGNGHIETWLGRPLSDLRGTGGPDTSDFWRASQKGQLYRIRGYTEDANLSDVSPGTTILTIFPIWRVGEILYFAARFLDQFEGVETVIINCRFTGLSGRRMESRDIKYLFASPPCGLAEFEERISVELRQLEENMVEVVHQLLSPLYKVFDFDEFTQDFVRQELDKLRKL